MDAGSTGSIASFFAHKSVFLTGATGFVGRALLEKILWGCPEVAKIYVLVRSKRDKSGEERLQTILQAELFERVRDTNPGLLKKVIAINGDVTSEELGIRYEDMAKVRENVSVIIHSAANVNFTATVQAIIKTNVEGTKNVIEWAKQLHHLQAFVYVSTQFSNDNRMEIDEKVYPIDLDPLVVIKLCADLPADVVDSILPQMLRGHGTCYVLSKHLAEVLVHDSRFEIPMCIVRPSIVVPAALEPFPGWIDNFMGFNGAIAAISKGVLRAFYTNKSGTLEIIPVDHVVNLTLAAATRLGCTPEKRGNLAVYNCSTNSNPWILSGAKRSLLSAIEDTPFNETLWSPSIVLVNSRVAFDVLDFTFHYIPAVLADGILNLIGKKPKVSIMNTYLKLKKLLDLTYKITARDYSINMTNMKRLYENLTPEDQETFNFNIFELDYEDHMRKGLYGMRRYAAQEKDEDLPKARKRMQRLRVFYNLSWVLLFFALACFIRLMLTLF